jgi:hypothetical protein
LDFKKIIKNLSVFYDKLMFLRYNHIMLVELQKLRSSGVIREAKEPPARARIKRNGEYRWDNREMYWK